MYQEVAGADIVAIRGRLIHIVECKLVLGFDVTIGFETGLLLGNTVGVGAGTELGIANGANVEVGFDVG